MDLEGHFSQEHGPGEAGATSARTTRVQILAELRPPGTGADTQGTPLSTVELAVGPRWSVISRNVATNFRPCRSHLVWPGQVDAQIYAWRDAAGNLVLSDRRLDDAAVTYAVPDAPQFRATRPAVADQTVVRERFEPLVQEHAARQSLRPDLVRAVIQVESGFNPHARSPKGAMGLMQLMPATARDLGVHNAYDPGENIRGGTLYLRQLLDRFDGDEELALAAYNAGPNAVDRYGRRIPPIEKPGTTCGRSARQPSSGTVQPAPHA